MTFVEFVRWLATAGALGVVSSVVVQALKALVPGLADIKAKIISILVATFVSIVATLAVPYLGQVPADVERFWPLIVWAVSQLWYEVIKARAARSG